MKKSLRRVLPLFIVAMCLLGASAARGAVTPAFTDVAPGNSNILFINYLSSRGIIGGFPDGTYRPGEGLTRAEAAAVLAKAAGLAQSSGASSFSDVSSHWAAGVINAAAAAGMITGYPDGTFRPDAMISRAEGITLFLGLSKQPDPGVALPLLEDVSGGHWAARPVAIGLASGMVGLGGKNFFPDSSLSRGDMARILGVLLTKDPDLSRTDLKITFKTTGTAAVTRKGSGETEEITPGASVQVNAGDIIKTGGSTAELVFPDGSGMLLEEESELTVKEARGRSYITAGGRPGVAVDWLNLDMDKGGMFGTLAKNYRQSAASGEAGGERIAASDIRDLPSVAGLNAWNMKDLLLAVGEAGAGEEVPWWESSSQQTVRVQVDMPWGVAGVRGTTWRIALEDDGDASFSILEGEGELTAGGATQSVSQLQVVTVPYGAAPGQASAMSPEEIKSFVQEAVRQWLQERAEDMQANSQLYVQVDEAAPPSIVEIINQAIEEAVRESQPQQSNSSGRSSSNDGNDDDAPTAPGVIQYYSHENFLRGFAEADNTVYITNGGGDTWSGSADADGYFAVEIGPQEHGDILLVKSVNASGNTSPESEMQVKDKTYLTVPNMECELYYGTVKLVAYLTDQGGNVLSEGNESVTFSVYDYYSGRIDIDSLTPLDGRIVTDFQFSPVPPDYYQIDMMALYEGSGLYEKDYGSGCITATYPDFYHLTGREMVAESGSPLTLAAFLTQEGEINDIYSSEVNVEFFIDKDKNGVFDSIDEYVGQSITSAVYGIAAVYPEPIITPGGYRVFALNNDDQVYDISYLFIRDPLSTDPHVAMGLERGYYVIDYGIWYEDEYIDSIECSGYTDFYNDHPLVLEAAVDVPLGLESVSNPLVKFYIYDQEGTAVLVGTAEPDQAGRVRCKLDQSVYESLYSMTQYPNNIYSVNCKAVFTGTEVNGDFSVEFNLPVKLTVPR